MGLDGSVLNKLFKFELGAVCCSFVSLPAYCPVLGYSLFVYNDIFYFFIEKLTSFSFRHSEQLPMH